MMMKTLIAVHHFPPTFRGGAEWRAYRTARALQQAGHQVQVVCADSITHGDGKTLECAKTTYEGVSIHRLYFNLLQAPEPLRWRYRHPLVGRYVSDLLKEFRPHVLHLISGYLMSGSVIEAAQAVDVPTVVTLTDFWFLCPRITLVRSDGSLCSSPADPLACALCLRKEQRRYRLPDQSTGGWAGKMLSFLWQKSNDELVRALEERKAYLLSLLNTVNAVISPSLFLKEMFECLGISPQRFLYMRQGLDVDNWVDAEPVASDWQLRIGYIGQIARHKGVDVLVNAFCRLHGEERKPQLLIYGDPEQFPDFAKRLRKQQVNGQDNVILAGRFDHSQIGRVLAELDVLVVPSVWYENSPNVILEAFATGTPVVVSRLGGMAELVTDGVNGFQFEAGDAEALAHVLQRFIDQPDLSASLRRGIPPVKTVQEEIKELLQLYATLEVKQIV
jgi:glycosyltransferase involved in cell wall biosynthesis